jgi:tRNA uridine 5-carbamoylmethylation protein Kti12
MRNIDRNSKENKWIPPSVIKSMIDSYQEPTSDEGFSKIILM